MIREQLPPEANEYRFTHPTSIQLELLEYGDYTNVHSQTFQNVLVKILPRFQQAIRYNFRPLPNLDNPQALFLALASEAARRQGKFWPMHQALFSHSTSHSIGTLSSLAVELGLQEERFLNDLYDKTVKDTILAQLEADRTLGITIAPTLFIDSQRVLGKLTQARLIPLIQYHLTHTPVKILSTVNKSEGFINWSSNGYHF